MPRDRTFAPGLTEYNNTVYVIIKAKDRIGSETNLWLDTTVRSFQACCS